MNLRSFDKTAIFPGIMGKFYEIKHIAILSPQCIYGDMVCVLFFRAHMTKCHSIRHQTPKFPTPPKSYATIFFGLLRTLFWSN